MAHPLKQLLLLGKSSLVFAGSIQQPAAAKRSREIHDEEDVNEKDDEIKRVVAKRDVVNFSSKSHDHCVEIRFAVMKRICLVFSFANVWNFLDYTLKSVIQSAHDDALFSCV